MTGAVYPSKINERSQKSVKKMIAPGTFFIRGQPMRLAAWQKTSFIGLHPGFDSPVKLC